MNFVYSRRALLMDPWVVCIPMVVRQGADKCGRSLPDADLEGYREGGAGKIGEQVRWEGDTPAGERRKVSFPGCAGMA